jgi:hypothetical protein
MFPYYNPRSSLSQQFSDNVPLTEQKDKNNSNDETGSVGCDAEQLFGSFSHEINNATGVALTIPYGMKGSNSNGNLMNTGVNQSFVGINNVASEVTEEEVKGGYLARSVIAPGVYYIGIVDILQGWTYSKQLERFVIKYSTPTYLHTQ